MSVTNRIAIIGVGNIIRSDDGIGSFVCSAMGQLNIPGVTIFVVHQLNTEIIEDLLPYNHVLIVDASLEGEDIAFRSIQKDRSQAFTTSHHMNAEMLQAVAQKVYGKSLSIFTCAVKGENFEIGEQLSDKAKTNTGRAIQLIESWIASLSNTFS